MVLQVPLPRPRTWSVHLALPFALEGPRRQEEERLEEPQQVQVQGLSLSRPDDVRFRTDQDSEFVNFHSSALMCA